MMGLALLKLALRPWRAAPVSQAIAIASVGFLLFVSMLMLWMEGSLTPLIARIQSEQVLTAYLLPTVPRQDDLKIVDTIRLSVPDASVDLVTPEDFLSRLKPAHPALSRRLIDLGGELHEVVPRYVTIAGRLPGGLADSIRAMSGIESVESSADRYRHVVDAFVTLQWFARALLVGLSFALLAGLAQVSRTNGYLFADALGVLRLWGADPVSMRIPPLASGLLVGLGGGLVAFAAWLRGGGWLADQFRAVSPVLAALPDPGPSSLAFLVGAGALFGLLSAVFTTPVSAGAKGRA